MSRRARDRWIGGGLVVVGLALLLLYANGVQAGGQWAYTFWFVRQWFS